MQHSARCALHVCQPEKGQCSERRRLRGYCCRPAQYVIAESTCCHRPAPWAEQHELRTTLHATTLPMSAPKLRSHLRDDAPILLLYNMSALCCWKFV